MPDGLLVADGYAVADGLLVPDGLIVLDEMGGWLNAELQFPKFTTFCDQG